MNLRRAIELRKAKYIKRTGGPGSYKYQYGQKKGPKAGKDEYEAFKERAEKRGVKKPKGYSAPAAEAHMKEQTKIARKPSGKEKEGKEDYSDWDHSELVGEFQQSMEQQDLINYVAKKTKNRPSEVEWEDVVEYTGKMSKKQLLKELE